MESEERKIAREWNRKNPINKADVRLEMKLKCMVRLALRGGQKENEGM